MSWRTLLQTLRWHTTGQATQLAQSVAEVCREPAFELVYEKAATMSGAEAKGYIAARCSPQVAHQAQQILRKRGLQESLQPELTRRAVSCLATMVLGDVLNAARRQPVLRKAA